jgi:two-component system chemotaxis response regulator CheB
VKRLRAVIVDDSLFMRVAVRRVLEADGRFEVVGEGRDGVDGVDTVLRLAPDVVTMDFNMPRLDGAGAVREIMAQRPTPIVMLSAHTVEGARETLDALAAGAVDFLTKPSGEVSADFSTLGPDLCARLAAAAGAAARPATSASSLTSLPAIRPSPAAAAPPGTVRLLVIAVSTGGPAALSRLVPGLPRDLGPGVIVVQHMPAQFTAALAERLAAGSSIEVREARAGDRPRSGLILVAPGDRHLALADSGAVRLEDGPEINGCRPSADVTLASAARVFGRRAAGLVMTGMGRDGTDGLAAIRAAGGLTLAQDRASSVIWGMPRAAIEAGLVDEVLSLDELPGRIGRL